MKKIILLCLLSLSLFGGKITANQLYINANGYHIPQGQLKQFDAFYVEGGKVITSGKTQSLVKRFPNATVVNLHNKTVLPGLIDGHGHMSGLGFNLQRISLRDSPSEQDSVAQVLKFANSNPNLSWIRGRGWNQVLWKDKRFPTKASLDEKLSKRPVWLRRVDGHAGWANSNALKLAGINRDTMSPNGGEIIKDKLGEPTGILIDNAMDLIEIKIESSTIDDVKRALQTSAKHLHKIGITSVHDAGIDKLTYRAYLELAKQQKLAIRTYAMIDATDPDFNAMLHAGKIKTPDNMLDISSVKISADGALGSRGAAMLAPYTDAPNNTGLLLHTPEKLEFLMKRAIMHGFQTNVHAIGDKANHIVLNLFEKFNQQPESRALRHRIEHAQVIAIEDIPRFKQLDILPSMQPTHATSDKNMAQDRIGVARLKGAYAWRTFLDNDVKVISGSDFPIEYANPFYGLHAAISRQDRDNMPSNGWLSHEAMTLTQALNSFTFDAAYGAHQEKIVGSLAPGTWADFIVVDLDIFDVLPSQLWQTKVEQTWIAGKKVYQR